MNELIDIYLDWWIFIEIDEYGWINRRKVNIMDKIWVDVCHL